MASSAAKHLVCLFFLFTILSSLHSPTHARDSQFFNKLPSSTNSNNNVGPDKAQPLNNQQEDQEPSFQPENENGYGLDGQKSSLLPSSATTTTTTTSTTIPLDAESKQPLNKYLPKNYNPVAYVTEPDDTSDTSTTFTEEKNYPNNNNYFYNTQQEEESEYRNYPTSTTNNRNNNYYNGDGSFNTDPQGMSDTRFMGSATTNSRGKYFNNGGEINSYQPQGMSDTRFLENGKYFYDVNSQKYSSNHPYTSMRGVRTRNVYNNRNYYGNNENAYEFNSEDSINGGYQNQDDFQDEEDNNMP